jgi:hypothetical protein
MQKSKFLSNKVDANFTLPDDLSLPLLQLIRRFRPNPRTDYLIDEVASKFVSTETDPPNVRRQRAINKWLATERENEATNERLMIIDPGYQILPGVTYESFMEKTRSIIVSLLGETVPEAVLYGQFSSGASTSRNRTSSHLSGKYVGKADVTTRALPYALDLLEASCVWSAFRDPFDYRVIDSNVLFTVPKKIDIDRCACKEPDINMYLQKGAGNFIRNSLRRVGIDLNDQFRNRALAKRGSFDNSLATIDLSSASDSISRELVFQCLPTLWYSFLDDIRCHTTVIDGDVHVNEMFSSMGNGFTFELESLLFYSIAKSVAWLTRTSGTISVYGDDIIVPTQMCQDLMWVLGVLGFSSNEEKTFFDGPFRESCGGHFLSGNCVTPFYIRKPITSLTDLINVANQLRKWASKDVEGLSVIDDEYLPAWQLLAERIPKCFWGGHDFEDTTRLVSFFKPRNPKALRPISPERDTGVGGYLHWLDFKGLFPDSAAMQSSKRTVFTGRYRARKVHWDYRVTEHVFLSELVYSDI